MKLDCNELGYNKLGYNKLGYNKLGYNKLGYNKLGYNQLPVITNNFFSVPNPWLLYYPIGYNEFKL